jgi:hypothetical protein
MGGLSTELLPRGSEVPEIDPETEDEADHRIVCTIRSTDGDHIVVIRQVSATVYRLRVYISSTYALLYTRDFLTLSEIQCTMTGPYILLMLKNEIRVYRIAEEREVCLHIPWGIHVIQYGVNALGYFYYTFYRYLDPLNEESSPDDTPTDFLLGIFPSSEEDPLQTRSWRETGILTYQRIWINDTYLFVAMTRRLEDGNEKVLKRFLLQTDLSSMNLDTQSTWSVSLESFYRHGRLILWNYPSSTEILLGGPIDIEVDEDDEPGYSWWRLRMESTEPVESVQYAIPRICLVDSVTIFPTGIVNVYHRQHSHGVFQRIRLIMRSQLAQVQDSLVNLVVQKVTGRCIHRPPPSPPPPPTSS